MTSIGCPNDPITVTLTIYSKEMFHDGKKQNFKFLKICF